MEYAKGCRGWGGGGSGPPRPPRSQRRCREPRAPPVRALARVRADAYRSRSCRRGRSRASGAGPAILAAWRPNPRLRRQPPAAASVALRSAPLWLRSRPSALWVPRQLWALAASWAALRQSLALRPSLALRSPLARSERSARSAKWALLAPLGASYRGGP